MGGPVGRSFTFDFAGPLPAVWAAMADTARYNAAAGLPKHDGHRGAPARRQHAVHGPGQGRAVRARVGGPALQLGARALVRASPPLLARAAGAARCALRARRRRPRAATATTGWRWRQRACSVRAAYWPAASCVGGERMFLRLAAQADRFALGAAQPALRRRPRRAGAGPRASGSTAWPEQLAASRLRPRPGRAPGRPGGRGARGRRRAHPAAARWRAAGACRSAT